MEHVPVLLDEILRALSDRENSLERVLDCTLGLGGYTVAILETFPGAQVWGIDQDSEALAIAAERASGYGDRFHPVHGNFSAMDALVGDEAPFDAILFDLGVSNLQLTSGERGFSFQEDGPLDMRMDASSPLTAADLVNEGSEKDLADIFWKYGEERFSRPIARGIVRFRQRSGRIDRTSTLVEIIRSTLPAPVQRKMGGHPARRVFQALRIAVNDELEALTLGLRGAKALCRDGGSILAVSYHSLEDRIVKHLFREWQQAELGTVRTRRPITPSDEETVRNHKARSAKLRIFSVGGSREGGNERRWRVR
ncbi:MAG TPA: 16S rRNA (cytosine(1402)-N(4))-methyltransferase RsmH [Synergistaceae bacterium]|jgi:16S rRNA (cytosine1402-N4)-methyltransferase|nr:16S rRNA (cytosine(1402)-N(4))-methyltransferase RsmH [Synergistaceae bacterium]